MLRQLDLLVRDLIYGLRQLVRAPTFTLAATASLGLGVALNASTFSVVNALLLRPIVSSAPSEVFRVGRSLRGDGSFRGTSYKDYLYLRAHASRLSAVFGEHIEPLTLVGPEGASIVSGEIVTDNYFSALGVTVALGRGFTTEADPATGGAAVAVISDSLWRNRFRADHGIVGRPVTINTRFFIVVGVAPHGFRGTFPGISVDVWIPAMVAGEASPIGRPGDVPTLMVMARLRPGESPESAAAELDTLALRLAQEDPDNRDRGFTLAPARGAHPFVARFIGGFLWLLLGVVFLVLLIACANVGSLLLARATARRVEIAARLALGASRSRLISQLLVESFLLAAIGAGAGVLITIWSLSVINSLVLLPGPTGAPIFMDLRVDHRVVVFSACSAAIAALVFGLAPALQATRIDVVAGLKGLTSPGGVRRSRVHGALVMTEVALSAALLIASVLLSRSLMHACRVDVGFRPDGLVVASFNVELPGYDASKRRAFYEALLDTARQLPGVEHAALADFVPMGDRGGSVRVIDPDAAPVGGGERLEAAYNRISPDYLATVGQRIVRGREFTDRDHERSVPVAIVNEALASRFWPDGRAVGRRVQVVDETTPREVIGVVANARFASFGDRVGPLILLPARQRGGSQLTLHVRSASPPSSVLSDIVRLASALDPNVAIQKGTTMRAAMAFSLFPAEVARAVFGIAALIGIVLASCGVYALVSYTCEQRLKDVGVMVALGASPRHVFRTVVGGTLVFVSIGLLAGAIIAGGAMRVFRSLLYGVSSWDPLTFAAVAIGLAGIALAAGVAAARKGLRLDPVVALRDR